MRKSDAQAWKIAILVAAIIAVIAVGTLSVMQAPPDRIAEREKAKQEKAQKEQEAKERAMAARMERAAKLREKMASYIAQVTHTHQAEWGDDRPATEDDNHLSKGQQVDLLKGQAQITFGSGAKVILEGPAKFRVLTRTSADLSTGKMVADVPDDVQSFTINTPVAKIVDADFVKSTESEGTPDEPRPIRLGKGESIRIGEGESVRID